MKDRHCENNPKDVSTSQICEKRKVMSFNLHDSVILVANNEEHAYCTSSYARDGVYLTRSQRG